ncbi:exonuclease subunit SbcD [Treponema sp.]
MKFLHTADLHLGRVFHDRSLIEDQALVLEGLLDQLAQDDYAALLICGDLYDRAIPSSEAVNLFSSFLGRARSRFPDLAIFIISGNHDSADRLAFASSLFTELGIHIQTEAEKAFEPILIQKNGESCAFFLLPFLSAGCLGGTGEEPLRGQAELALEAATRLELARQKAVSEGATATVLLAHLFTLGGTESESERSFLGTAERVDAKLFSGFDYVALGHLHRAQKASGNMWYSGSPLAYSFDEAGQEKAFLAIELGEGSETRVEKLPIQALRPLRCLSGTFASFLEEGAYTEEKKCYVQISLSDPELVLNPLSLLKTHFPFLLSITQEEALSSIAERSSSKLLRPELSGKRGAVEDFSLFLEDLYGSADAEEIELFRKLAGELEHETT